METKEKKEIVTLEEALAALQIAVDALSKLRGHSEIAHDACERILRKNPGAFRRAANIDAKLDLFDEMKAMLERMEHDVLVGPFWRHAIRALLAKIKG